MSSYETHPMLRFDSVQIVSDFLLTKFKKSRDISEQLIAFFDFIKCSANEQTATSISEVSLFQN